MKRFKIAAAALAVLAVVVASFAFTNKGTDKPFSIVTKLYDVSANNIIATSGSNALVLSELGTQGNWSTDVLGSHGNTSRLYAIQYEGTQLTFQQAIDAVKTYFQNNGTLPADGNSFDAGGSKFITVFRMP